MSSLLGTYYKWRLKTPQERVAKFQEEANNLLTKNNAKIISEVRLVADKDEKLITDRFEKLKEKFNIQVQAYVEMIPLKWPDEIKKEEEEKKEAEKNNAK